jgi:hypothetical protein
MSQIKCLSLVAGAGVSLTAALTASAVTPVANTDEVRAIVSEMLADAENRSSLLAAGGGGHDGGTFYLADANGNFRLNVGGQIQFRYLLNFRDDNGDGTNALPNRENDDFESGFQTANTRVWFTGNIVDPNLYYNITGNFARDGGDFNLEEAYAGYKWDNGFSLQWGQFVLPFLREKLVNQWYQLAADRSLTDITFDQGYSQGIQLGYAAEEFRAMLAFSDGFRSANSEFGSVNNGTTGNFGFTGQGGESDWAITARAEFKFAGAWDQFKDFTSMPESQFAAMLGIAGHVEGSANDIGVDTDGDGAFDAEAETRFGGVTVDLSLEGDGWNVFIAGNAAFTDNSATAGAGLNDSTTDYGLVAQGGFFFPDTDWELFARYDGIFADEDRNAANTDSNDSFSTVTVGTNYYWSGHAAKFTFDVQYFIDNAADGLNTVTNREIGYLGSGEDGEVTLRFQFQLLF